MIDSHRAETLAIAEPARVDVVARPALPGVRIMVGAVTGTVPAGPGHPLAPAGFTAEVEAVGAPDAAVAVPAWLAAGPVTAPGAVVGLVPVEPGVVRVELVITLGPRTVPLSGTARTRIAPAGSAPTGRFAVDVVGSALCDPRSLGFALPPLVNHVLTVRWQLRLLAAGA